MYSMGSCIFVRTLLLYNRPTMVYARTHVSILGEVLSKGVLGAAALAVLVAHPVPQVVGPARVWHEVSIGDAVLERLEGDGGATQ